MSPGQVPTGPFATIRRRIDATSVSLRFFGDELDPALVTDLLGSAPTTARCKGEVIRTGEVEHIAETSSWLLASERQSYNTLDAQIAGLFARLTDDLKVWRDLTFRYRADLFCGVWSEEFNRGLEISAEVIDAISARGLALAFDVYFVESPQ